MINSLLKGLTPEQAQFVDEYDGGVARALAIPGSGKTHTVIRLAQKLWKKYPQSQSRNPPVRMVTFTKKASHEASERLQESMDRRVGGSVTTFHGIAVQIYRSLTKCRSWPIDCNLKRIDKDEFKVVSKIIEKKFSDQDIDADDVFFYYNNLCNNIRDMEDFYEAIYSESSSPRNHIIKMVLSELIAVLKKKKVIPLNLIIPVAVSHLKEKDQGICEWIIVDEFQDTNNSQFEFTKQLVKPFNNIVVVGDLHQAIYKWRGAHPENLDTVIEKDFPDVKTYHLSTNFRSTNNILKAGSLVLPTFYEEYFRHKSFDKRKGSPVLYREPESPQDEYDHICKWIKEMVNHYGYKRSELMVLYRKTGFLPALERTLIQNEIPYVKYGGVEFFSKKEVRDIIAYMTWITSPDDFTAGKRVVNFPRRGAGEKTRESLDFNYMQAEWPDKLKDLQKKLIKAHEMCKNKKWTPVDLVQYIYLDLELKKAYKKDDQIESLQVILEWAYDYKEQELDCKDIVNEMIIVQNPPKEKGDTVKLMTIHASKGLEASAVYLCHAVDGVIPNLRRDVDLQEECHLMYVALTRAKEHLCISAPQEIFNFGSMRSSEPSRYLDCILEEMSDAEISIQK